MVGWFGYWLIIGYCGWRLAAGGWVRTQYTLFARARTVSGREKTPTPAGAPRLPEPAGALRPPRVAEGCWLWSGELPASEPKASGQLSRPQPAAWSAGCDQKKAPTCECRSGRRGSEGKFVSCLPVAVGADVASRPDARTPSSDAAAIDVAQSERSSQGPRAIRDFIANFKFDAAVLADACAGQLMHY